MATKSDSSCIFCKIIQGGIPSHKVFEDDHTFAFMDINPLSDNHVLVIPKYHTEKLHELPPEEMASIGPALVKISKAIGAENYNILQNNGSLAHQVVKHVHFHIIPKPNKQDGLGIDWPTKDTNHEKFKKQAEEIKTKL